jgi:hypothetical protein
MDSYKCDRFVFFLRQLMECYCTQLNFETEINSYKKDYFSRFYSNIHLGVIGDYISEYE